MKKRTFFATLLLFLLFFNVTILLVSVITLKDNYKAVQDKCLAEHYIIATSLINDIQALENRGMDPGSSISQLMQPYTRYSQNKRMELALSLDDQWIYRTNESGELPALELPDFIPDTTRQLFTETDGSPVLYVYGRFPVPYQEYGLLYHYDLSEMTASWRKMKNMLFLTGLSATILLSCCLNYLLNVVFRPMDQISEASRNIAAGNYDQRLSDSGTDEVAAMAHSFNLMAQEIEQQIEQLRQAAEQKQQFIDNFAHELRTPLTAIYGYAEYIQKAVISEEDKYSSTDFIMSECRRLQNMAAQLLELATLRTDDIPMDSVCIEELLEKACSTMRPKALKLEVTLSIGSKAELSTLQCGCNPNIQGFSACPSFCSPNRQGTPVSPSSHITGNPELLESLLCNLIDNSLKACHPHGKILLGCCCENNSQIISVCDDGIGMQPEQLSHITEAFYRADKARTRQLGGAGLGLSLCESIAGLHDARLHFDSQPGKGTVAQIIFH